MFASVRSEVPGPRSRLLRDAEALHLAPGTQRISQLAGIAIEGGEGALLRDVDGNTFIDFVAGIGVASVGHGHPGLAAALAEQAAHCSAGSFATAARSELLARIAAVAPAPHLTRTQLYSGGAEAVESAIKLARAHTGKHEVLAFWGGFHGKSGGVLGLCGSDFKHGLGPLPAGQLLSPFPDTYRCPFGITRDDPATLSRMCIDFLRQVIRHQSSGSLAAILVEPVQGTAGNVVPPPGFLAAVQKVAREHGALLILDEMITGWGRTGRLWGAEHDGVSGDIVIFGKGFGGGFPVSGVLSSGEIMAAEPWSRPSFSSSSYGGGPLAAAAANAVTRTIVEDKLAENAARVGATLLRALQRIGERHPFVGEVRGRGLLIGMELVQDRRSREPLAKADCEWLFQQCLQRGLLTMAYSPRLRINPPLVITEEQALEGAAILDDALTAFAAERRRFTAAPVEGKRAC